MFTKGTILKIAISFIIMIIPSLIIIGLTLFQNYQSEKEEEFINYHYIIGKYQLDYVYETNENGDDFVYIPTAETEDTLRRWRNLSEVYSVIVYPEEAIKKGDWLTVNEVFSENFSSFHVLVNEMYDDASIVSKSELGSELGSQRLIRRYILSGLADGRFLEVLIDLGFEEPQNEEVN
ncbi:hypothetical protein [Salipaludibacillus agaradhaerens]|uniref:hypothetical protein n=1 Tax=Salipaludibacillus agaradhaerens TaxID=76935 RepID=UPI000998A4B2|nr:hypothetical protein [Salipaludibacillus agaradhaerens]